MDKKAILLQLIKLLNLHYIDCMEAKTLLRNQKEIDPLFICEVAFALYAYANVNKIDKQQTEICKIIMDILEAIKED